MTDGVGPGLEPVSAPSSAIARPQPQPQPQPSAFRQQPWDASITALSPSDHVDADEEAEVQAKMDSLLSSIRRRRDGIDTAQVGHSGRIWKRCRMRVRDWSALRAQEAPQPEAQLEAEPEAQVEAHVQAQAESQTAAQPDVQADIEPAPQPDAPTEIEPASQPDTIVEETEDATPSLPELVADAQSSPTSDELVSSPTPSTPSTKSHIPLPRDHLVLLIPSIPELSSASESILSQAANNPDKGIPSIQSRMSVNTLPSIDIQDIAPSRTARDMSIMSLISP